MVSDAAAASKRGANEAGRRREPPPASLALEAHFQAQNLAFSLFF